MDKKWRGEKLWMGLLAVGMVLGALAFVYISLFGHTHEFRTSWEPDWGLLVASYEFFVLCGAGLAVASAGVFLAGSQRIQGLCRRMATHSALGFVIGLGLVIIELTQPTRLSMASVLGPIFYKKLFLALSCFAATLGALVALHVQLRRNRAIAVLALAISVFLLSCLGIFQMGHVLGQFGQPPEWLTAPAFIDYLLAALLSGTALCVLILFLGSKFSASRRARDYHSVLQWLRTWSIACLSLYAFSMVIIFFTYASGQLGGQHLIAPFLFSGPLAFNFWGFQVVVGLLLPMLLLLISRAVPVERLALAAGLILTGQFFRSYDMILAGQLETFHSEASFLVKQGLLVITPCLPKTLVVIGTISFFLFVMTYCEKMKPWSDQAQKGK
ncbi:MAG: NrfD/PsrC family molybdoenzyme membrane anchor subunit [Desulfuromonadales bacterium]